MMRPKGKRISGAVRQAIQASGLSRYAICKAAGIDQAAMSRFMSGASGLTTASLDALAEVLGLRVVAEGPVKVLPSAKPGRKAKAEEQARREDEADARAALKARREKGEVPLADIKARLGRRKPKAAKKGSGR